MRRLMVVLLMLMAAGTAFAERPGSYREAIEQTVAMVSDQAAQRLAQVQGLQILNLTWEDTGRYKGSCVGPNISDMTLQVQLQDPKTQQYELVCLPVIRHDNFSDKTADISPDRFFVLVGNEKGKGLRRVSLTDLLGNLRSYMSKPDSWKGGGRSLLAKRDTHVLVSAQACFLPIPRQGKAEFNPVLFNYQSMAGDPAVLTILCTREGTSMTIIDNQRDGFEAGRTWGQRLFFNQNGERASLTGERESDFAAGPGQSGPSAAGSGGLNMVMLIQVPLKQKNPMRGYGGGGPMPSCAPVDKCASRSDVENAVIGHGKVEGPFTEIDGLAIERDERFPVRVTVQFYKATSNGVVSDRDMTDIAAQLKRVYAEGDYVGSLVVGGDTGRPTEYDGDKTEPPGWWNSFWERHLMNTGQTREEALRMLNRLLGGRPRNK